MIQIIDYSANLDLLLEQYKDSVKLRGTITAMDDLADQLEAALFEIRSLFYIDTAIGVQLDVIGSIFSVDRAGMNDDDYRTEIKIRGSLVTSGEPESIISILKALYGATFVNYTPFYPAGYYLDTDAAVTIAQLEIFSGAGIQPFLLNYLIDANANYIVDANGDKIRHVG